MRIQARGTFLLDGEQKFFVRGVTYGPFRPRSDGAFLPEAPRAAEDLEGMRRLGANTVRVYHLPPAGFREQAAEAGLRLLVGVPWAQHLRFLDTRESRAQIRQRVREAARSLRDAPNLLGLVIGNEISPQVVRWYGAPRVERFLGELADEVRQADPDALVTYANYPMTEYLELGGQDFVSFNVYLHREPELRRYVARLQNLAAGRPLLLAEFGVDAWRESEAEQARIVSRTATAAFETGCVGAVVFSFTDEWFTGGHDIEDWSFGLVTRDRKPKPSFAALQAVYRQDHPCPPDPTPMVSVVVCAYDAERTIRECLESLTRLRYPDLEVIVVNDGSRDRTPAIAREFPRFRLLEQENRGLSAARNAGIEAARGEVVAFTDADCAVDPDWLVYLVRRLQDGGFAGVGGPNVPPPEDHWVPDAVARAPGGPTHVLLTDLVAEHVPGCNMAFWRRHLVEVGGFDPVYRTAGDDVDMCWRLQNEGHELGFAASALVWHRRRHTVSAYLAQQRGYGRAESLLYFKHPYRFNLLGHSRWLGRIYGDLGAGILARRPRIYSGAFGGGLFQTLYEAPSSFLRHLPATLEWNLAALGLTATGALSYLTTLRLPTFLVLGLGLFALSMAQAIRTALQVDVSEVRAPAWKVRGLVALLTYLGPLARAVARIRGRSQGLSRVERIRFPALRQAPQVHLFARSLTLSYWNTTGIDKEACLGALVDFLRPRKYPVLLDDGWKPWDVAVHRGVWMRAQVKVLVQDHGGADRQVDVGVRLRRTRLARTVQALAAAGTVLAWTAGIHAVALLLLAALVGTEAFLIHQALRLGRTLYHAVEITFQRLPLAPLRPLRARPPSDPR